MASQSDGGMVITSQLNLVSAAELSNKWGPPL